MPPEFLAAEIDRYMVMPGQALAYLTGKLEIIRIREEAQRRLGPEFSLPAFHAAVLDHGSLPMPTLARSIDGLAGPGRLRITELGRRDAASGWSRPPPPPGRRRTSPGRSGAGGGPQSSCGSRRSGAAAGPPAAEAIERS